MEMLKRTDVVAIVGVSSRTLDKMIESDGFPKPYRISERVLRWDESDVRKWVDSRNPKDGAK